jgi:hypothetical protein
MPKKMTRDDAIYISGIIKEEGFDYCFESYSDFKDIDDEEFHKLRNDYLTAMKKLFNYIDDQIE